MEDGGRRGRMWRTRRLDGEDREDGGWRGLRTEDEVGRRGWRTARTEMMEVEEEDKDGMEDRGGGDKSKPHRKRGSAGNHWLWRNMYSVAEEEEENLADFGLQHLESDAHAPNHHHRQLHHDEQGGYEALLLEEDDHTVDDLICNPMGVSQEQPHNREHQLPNNQNREEETFDTFVLLRSILY